MATAIDWARDHGYQNVVLETSTEQEGAIAFYNALGFREVGRSTFKRWQMVWFEYSLKTGATRNQRDAASFEDGAL
jgi:hypothetical protein